jgi:hypothetical protein
MRRFAFAILGVLLLTLAASTSARAGNKTDRWAFDTGPGFRLGNQDSDFGFSSPWTAWLDYTFNDDDEYDLYGETDYLWSTSDNINTSSWGLGIGARTARPWYVTGAISYDLITSDSGHINGIGGYVGTGYIFSPHPHISGGPYIETKYVFLPAPSGANNNVLNLSLGYRF